MEEALAFFVMPVPKNERMIDVYGSTVSLKSDAPEFSVMRYWFRGLFYLENDAIIRLRMLMYGKETQQ